MNVFFTPQEVSGDTYKDKKYYWFDDGQMFFKGTIDSIQDYIRHSPDSLYTGVLETYDINGIILLEAFYVDEDYKTQKSYVVGFENFEDMDKVRILNDD